MLPEQKIPFNIFDICGLVGIPVPANRAEIEVRCPACDGKRLNINLRKQVFNCCRCGTGGGMTKLYSLYMNVAEHDAFKSILSDLGRMDNVKSAIPMPARRIFPVIKENELASIEKRDKTYNHFMSDLVLGDAHMQSLLARGLTKEEIEWLGYKSAPVTGHRLLVEQLQMNGCYLGGVPGFYKKGERWELNSPNTGIMIPVYDLVGKVQGITVRLDKVRTGGKFRWLTSTGREEGSKASTWAHYTGGWKGEETIILTEGPMKADILYMITRKPVIAIPGVSAQDGALEMLAILKAQGLKHVRIALDMDYLDDKTVTKADGTVETVKPQVYKDYASLIKKITGMGLTYTRIKWNRDYKGIDDFLAAKHRGVRV